MWAKREDCNSGIAYGGNKTRKLEYLVADALARDCDIKLRVLDYVEHAVGAGTDATAVAYVEATDASGRVAWGVGKDANILTASLKAVVSSASRLGLKAVAARPSNVQIST